jgi:hypothetical protein
MRREARLSALYKLSQSIEDDGSNVDVDALLSQKERQRGDEETVKALMTAPLISSEGQFGSHEVFIVDPTFVFEPENLNRALKRAGMSDWITMPHIARKKNVPVLFYLDPDKASKHELYFGVKTEYGYLHTPATFALNMAASRKMFTRSDFSKLYRLETPADLRNKHGSYVVTLDPSKERDVVRDAMRYVNDQALSVHGVPGLKKTFMFPDGTLGHMGNNDIATDRAPDISENMRLREEFLNSALAKGLESYPKLKETVDAFVVALNNRMPRLLAEQRSANKTVNFQGRDFRPEDIFKQNMFRLILEAIKADNSPLNGVEYFVKTNDILV